MSEDNFKKDLASFLNKKLRWDESQLRDYINEFEASKTSVKDYEIIAVRDDSGKLWYTDMLPKGNEKIEVVKRLSDNEVFCVGDTINDTFIKNVEILGFEPTHVGLDIKQKSGVCNLKSISKAKKILFTTNDNVPIYKGDKYFFVDCAFWEITQAFGNSNSIPKCKTFSTEEAAKYWVELNRPAISVNDVLEITRTINDGAKGFDTKHYINKKIKELAKQKLKELAKQKLKELAKQKLSQ